LIYRTLNKTTYILLKTNDIISSTLQA